MGKWINILILIFWVGKLALWSWPKDVVGILQQTSLVIISVAAGVAISNLIKSERHHGE